MTVNGLADRMSPSPMDERYSQLVSDAFDLLDRYRAPIGLRDPVTSLNENPEELLGRVRAAVEPLLFDGTTRREDVAEMLRRIDEQVLRARRG